MQYTVNIIKARKIYKLADFSAKALVCLTVALPFSVGMVFLGQGSQTGLVAGIATGIVASLFSIALFCYMCTSTHAATRYVELIDYIRPDIVGCHARNARGSDGYDGMQEVYFTYRDALGDVQEFVLGIFSETNKHHFSSPMIDITNQKLYI